MSGVAAVFFRDGRPVDLPSLHAVATRIAHRGPDAFGIWQEGPAGLVHRALWTTPESVTERLPLERDGVVITADVRLDNRAELIAALGVDPHDKVGDAELILRAWERWGPAAPEHLLGDFAFALWDARRRALFCARDHIGVKPLYYHCTSSAVVTGSEIKALLIWPHVPRRLNEVRIGDYLQPCLEDKEITFYEDIWRLPPAHWMLASHERVELRQYWQLDPAREIRGRSDAEYAEEFRAIFTDAVRCRMRSAVRVGSLLSGGLDSSSIACTARALEPSVSLPTFSAIFDDVPECDERPWINAVLAQGGCEPHWLHADRISPLAGIEQVLEEQDEPFYAPNLFIHRALYGLARDAGVRVLFDGIDGDTTVSHGLAWLAGLLTSGRWPRLAFEVLLLARRTGKSPWHFLRRYALAPLAASLREPAPPRIASVVRAEFADRIGLASRLRAQGYGQPMLTSRDEHSRKLRSGIVPLALEIADKAAAASGLEPRYPYFDRRLVEFCLALPPEQKLRRGWIRYVARQALRGVLPESVCWRGGKANLGPNFARAVRAEIATLREILSSTRSSPYVSAASIDPIPGAGDRSARPDAELALWHASLLSRWLEIVGERG